MTECAKKPIAAAPVRTDRQDVQCCHSGGPLNRACLPNR